MRARKNLKLNSFSFYRSVIFGIDVVASQKSHIKDIKKAIDFIKQTDNFLFKKIKLLKAILIYPGKTDFGGILEGQRIYIDQSGLFKDVSLGWLASSIVHEAWHIDQYKRGIREYGARKERGAYLIQRRFLKKAGGLKGDIKWLDKMYKLQWWQPEPTAFKKKVGYDNKSVEETGREFDEFLKQYKQGKLRIKEIKV